MFSQLIVLASSNLLFLPFARLPAYCLSMYRCPVSYGRVPNLSNKIFTSLHSANIMTSPLCSWSSARQYDPSVRVCAFCQGFRTRKFWNFQERCKQLQPVYFPIFPAMNLAITHQQCSALMHAAPRNREGVMRCHAIRIRVIRGQCARLWVTSSHGETRSKKFEC